jgi:thiamine-phosphate pyrophosphorylase
MKRVSWTLCLIADVEAAGRRKLTVLIEKAVDAGATLVQLRSKKLSSRHFFDLALLTSEVLRRKNIPLIINDRLDIALACDADGVHLGQEDLPLHLGRKLLGRQKIIGITVNTAEEAIEAEASGADYLGVGPVFFTATKERLKPVLGLEGLRAIRKKVRLPILAVGGIKAENAAEVMATGVDGIAVASFILGSKDVRGATRELLRAVRKKKG